MYIVVVVYRVGVICRRCGSKIEIEDEYVAGVRAAEMAALYQPAGRKSDVVNTAWQKTLTCGNSWCRKTFRYRREDLLLYDGQAPIDGF